MTQEADQRSKFFGRVLLIMLLAALMAVFFWMDLERFFTLDYIKNQQQSFQRLFDSQPLVTSLAFMAIYIAVTAFSLPGATLLTLLAGALFGLWWGSLIVSFASTIGATFAFLTARFLLRDWVQKRFGERLKVVNDGIQQDGAFYLLTLRLVPVVPFFMINLLMGLTPIRLIIYFFVSQLGMLPGTFVYVNAGTQLGEIESLNGILSPGVLISFALLGVFPLLLRKLLPVFTKFIGSHQQKK